MPGAPLVPPPRQLVECELTNHKLPSRDSCSITFAVSRNIDVNVPAWRTRPSAELPDMPTLPSSSPSPVFPVLSKQLPLLSSHRPSPASTEFNSDATSLTAIQRLSKAPCPSPSLSYPPLSSSPILPHPLSMSVQVQYGTAWDVSNRTIG